MLSVLLIHARRLFAATLATSLAGQVMAAPSLAEQVRKAREAAEAADWREAAETAKETFQIDPATLARIRAIADGQRTPAWQARLEQANRAARRAIGLTDPDDAGGVPDDIAALTGTRIYLMLSASVPLATARNMIRDAARLDQAVVVMRGFIGGARQVQPTVAQIARWLRLDPACEGPDCAMQPIQVQVDPMLFRRYQVEAVPALVVASGIDYPGFCSEGDAQKTAVDHWHRVTGDAPIVQSLRELHARTQDPALPPLIDRLTRPRL